MEKARLELEDAGIADRLLDYLNEDHTCIEDAMDFSAMARDSRATLLDVTFTGVKLEADGSILLEYSYIWELHHGCKDINAGGHEVGSITGTYKNGAFEFDVIARPEHRSTLDEF